MAALIHFLPDGRKLAYTTLGEGTPVMYFHGTASSRLEIRLLQGLVEDSGLQLVGVDRPGYGCSTYAPRRNLSDFNADLNSLASHLGLAQFSLLGWSGGGAFALAYLTHNPDRVSRCVTVSAPALPFDVASAHNTPLARYLMRFPKIGEYAMTLLSRRLLKADGDTEAFLKTSQGKQLLHGCSKSDLAFINNREWVGLMYQCMAEAFRQGKPGVKATVEEHQLFVVPYNLPFNAVKEGQLMLWHGSEDKTCPIKNAHAIAALAPKAELKIFDAEGHFALFNHQSELAELLKPNV